jgi:hypothetical protein
MVAWYFFSRIAKSDNKPRFLLFLHIQYIYIYTSLYVILHGGAWGGGGIDAEEEESALILLE